MLTDAVHVAQDRRTPLRILMIIADQPRHLYYANKIHDVTPLCGLVLQTRNTETKISSGKDLASGGKIPAPPEPISEMDRKNWERHFGVRIIKELEYMGSFPSPPDVKIHQVPDMTAMNAQPTAAFVKGCQPDIVLLFGPGMVKSPLMEALPQDAINMHCGLSPRYRGGATLWWPFYMMEPNQAGVTFHRITAEADAGEILHQVRPKLAPEDGLHDVAQKAVVAAVEDMTKMIAFRNSGGEWIFKKQKSTGKNWLDSDFKPEHLRVPYTLFNDDMAKHYLDKTLVCKEPFMYMQPSTTLGAYNGIVPHGWGTPVNCSTGLQSLSHSEFGVEEMMKHIWPERPSIGALTPNIDAMFDRLWPLLRSITGPGVRETHAIIQELLPGLHTFEVPSGTKVFDWTVPEEWRCQEAYIIDPAGSRILDMNDSTLHIVNYSIGFEGKMSLEELQEHLHSLPEQPTAIPYVTSYYSRQWGFCLSQEQRDALKPGEYHIFIDAKHIKGSLTVSELVLPGVTNKEVMLSTYTCHPSLANNELSGPLVTATVASELAKLSREQRHFTYRFLFTAESIGTITYLALKGDHLKENVVAGYILTCVGDGGPYTFKASAQGNSLADRAARAVLQHPNGPCGNGPTKFFDYWPSGSDERQYCSPGFDLPMALISRAYVGYSEYHTSFDDKRLVTPENLAHTVLTYLEVCQSISQNFVFKTKNPECEPQLGKRGLYGGEHLDTYMWLMSQCRGEKDLIAVCQDAQLAPTCPPGVNNNGNYLKPPATNEAFASALSLMQHDLLECVGHSVS